MRETVRSEHGTALIAGLLVLLAAYVVWEAWRMPAGSAGLPGPALFPLGLAVMLAAAGAGVVVQALRARERDGEAVRLGGARVHIALGALVGVALVLERIGFLAAMTLFLALLLRAFAGFGWGRAVAAGALGAAVAHLVFQTVLGVNLPKGRLYP